MKKKNKGVKQGDGKLSKNGVKRVAGGQREGEGQNNEQEEEER